MTELYVVCNWYEGETKLLSAHRDRKIAVEKLRQEAEESVEHLDGDLDDIAQSISKEEIALDDETVYEIKTVELE